MKNGVLFLWVSVVGVAGFLLGIMQGKASEKEVVSSVPLKPEKAMIMLQKVEGDSLFVDITGEARIVWGEDHFLEEAGAISLGQIPDANDLQYRRYPFVGNENTNKFYPSDTSWARGVKVSDRRFFATKEEAIAAGFIPSKSVK